MRSFLRALTTRIRDILISSVKKPGITESRSPGEIIPFGFIRITLLLEGWGIVRLTGSRVELSQRWYFGQRNVNVLLPVNCVAEIALRNLWGHRRYQLDATPNPKSQVTLVEHRLQRIAAIKIASPTRSIPKTANEQSAIKIKQHSVRGKASPKLTLGGKSTVLSGLTPPRLHTNSQRQTKVIRLPLGKRPRIERNPSHG